MGLLKCKHRFEAVMLTEGGNIGWIIAFGWGAFGAFIVAVYAFRTGKLKLLLVAAVVFVLCVYCASVLA